MNCYFEPLFKEEHAVGTRQVNALKRKEFVMASTTASISGTNRSAMKPVT